MKIDWAVGLMVVSGRGGGGHVYCRLAESNHKKTKNKRQTPNTLASFVSMHHALNSGSSSNNLGRYK